MSPGILASRPASKLAATYLIFQAAVVLFTITSSFRCMCYHLYFQDVDVSKIIKVTTLWEIILWHTRTVEEEIKNPTADSLDSAEPEANLALRRQGMGSTDDELKWILQSYVSQKTAPVHIYQGMFDSRFIVHDKIYTLLANTITSAFPWKLQIESIDSIIMFYSLALGCLGVLFYTMYSKIVKMSEEGPTENASITDSDLLLFDLLFWGTMALFQFIMLEISSVVSFAILSWWQAMIYTCLVYLLCVPEKPAKHVQLALFAAFCLHVMLQTSFGHAGLQEGSASLISHMIVLIMCYISVSEPTNPSKFVNLRIWTGLTLNVIFLFVYVNNIEIIVVNE